MESKFLLGTISVTKGALVLLKRVPLDLVARHAVNDHGLITKSEQKTNEESMLRIGPIRSRYRSDPTKPKSKFVVIETDEKWTTTLVRVE